jgi:hypothetical protein
MTSAPKTTASAASGGHPHDRHHHLLERLIDRLPKRIQALTHWLRRPSSRWIRIPAGVLLVLGGFLSILPLFGLWMLPLGLLLLAEDVPPLRWVRNRALELIQRHRPHWLRAAEATQPGDSVPPGPPAASSDPHA